MNAIKFLLKEHDHVRKMFAEIAGGSHRYETQKKMFGVLCKELTVHEKMEQAEWYPCFKDNGKLKTIVEHLISEEKNAENTIKQFKKITSQENWETEFLKFKTDVDHHAAEEEKKLFPEVKKIIGDEKLESIGKKMLTFKKTAYKPRRLAMTKGNKDTYTDKQKRQAEHIEDGYKKRGATKKKAQRIAWATVNKENGGGKKSGAGRKKTSHTRGKTKRTSK